MKNFKTGLVHIHRRYGNLLKMKHPAISGILWVLQSGARWRDLPERYPSPATCWRRLRLWEYLGIWLDIWRALLAEVDEKQYLNWEETFADGSFAPARKGGSLSTKPNAARVRSGWW